MRKIIKAGKEDFDRIRSAYLDIIKRTPDMEKFARWEYGKHPTDEVISKFLNDGDMYLFMDGEKIAGVAAITFYQGEDYHPVKWNVSAEDDEVMSIHLLGITPDYQKSGVGNEMMKMTFDMGKDRGMKAYRLDALSSNIPAHKFYESLGFLNCGKQHWYAENTGWTDFCMYEKILE